MAGCEKSNSIGAELGLEGGWLVDRFHRLVHQVRQTAATAAKGTAVDRIEDLLLGEGRELLRQVAEHGVQTAADEAEKRGRVAARNAASPGGTRGTRKES
jgi:hypothetical protein